MESKQNPKKPYRNYVVFSGIAIQMGITIYLGVMLGKWIDGKMSLEKRYFTILFTFIAMLISIYSVVAQLKRFNEK